VIVIVLVTWKVGFTCAVTVDVGISEVLGVGSAVDCACPPICCRSVTSLVTSTVVFKRVVTVVVGPSEVEIADVTCDEFSVHEVELLQHVTVVPVVGSAVGCGADLNIRGFV
jgi:hypothetical protein